jgi:hypothetical protein
MNREPFHRVTVRSTFWVPGRTKKNDPWDRPIKPTPSQASVDNPAPHLPERKSPSRG